MTKFIDIFNALIGIPVLFLVYLLIMVLFFVIDVSFAIASSFVDFFLFGKITFFALKDVILKIFQKIA